MQKTHIYPSSPYLRLIVIFIAGFFFYSCAKESKQDLQTIEDHQLKKYSQIIINELDWKEVTALDNNHPVRINSYAVGDVDIPKIGSRCTGFLISENTIMTNHHCIPSASYATGVKVSFRHEYGIPKYNWETYDCSTFIGNNKALDFALLECQGSPGSSFNVATISRQNVNVNSGIYVVQQNCDYYSKRDCDWSKKFSNGSILQVANEYTHNADTLGGSSGSPVFSYISHEVIGIHHAGLGNNGYGRGVENYAVPMYKIANHIEQYFPNVAIIGSSTPSTPTDPTPSPPFEPNETTTNAYPITQFPFSESLEISSTNDNDFFKITVDYPGTVNIQMAFTHSYSDLDLKLFDQYQQVVAKSDTTSNYEGINIFLNPGTYYIYVYGYNRASGPYNMNVDFSFNAPVSDEPNDDITQATGITTPYNGQGKQIESNSDIDHYTFTVSSYKTVNINIAFAHASGDLDLQLLNQQGSMIKKSASTSNKESITTSLSQGTYIIKVYGYRGATGDYKLQVN